MHMLESLNTFFLSETIDFEKSLGNQCQNFCLKHPTLFSYCIVGVVVKDIARIYDIALHILVGFGKLTISAIKLIYSIPAKLWSSTPNHQKIGKEGLMHLGFSVFCLVDMGISITNVINRYPQDLTKKAEILFAGLFQVPKKQKADSNASLKKSKEQIEYLKLYSALVECGTDPEKSRILAENSFKYPKHFRNSLSSISSLNG
ncbi:MAG: hypothetical protein ACRCU0_03740 [Candidatus Rhabdochlamydia sp.]